MTVVEMINKSPNSNVMDIKSPKAEEVASNTFDKVPVPTSCPISEAACMVKYQQMISANRGRKVNTAIRIPYTPTDVFKSFKQDCAVTNASDKALPITGTKLLVTNLAVLTVTVSALTVARQDF